MVFGYCSSNITTTNAYGSNLYVTYSYIYFICYFLIYLFFFYNSHLTEKNAPPPPPPVYENASDGKLGRILGTRLLIHYSM